MTASKAAVAVVLIAVALAAASTIGDTLIVDEIPHIGAGYSYVATGDFRLNPEHPPLAKTLAGLMIAPWVDGTKAFESEYWTEKVNGQWNFGRTLIYTSGNDADLITFLARVPMLLFLVLTAYILWRWAHERYGRAAALIAVILIAFSPTILAHARYVTTDMAAAWGAITATYFFIRYLKAPSRTTFLWASIALGFGLLGKFSTFLLVPYFFVIAGMWALAEKHIDLGAGLLSAWRWWLRTAAVIAAGFILVVWPIYYLHTYHYPVERQTRDTASILSTHGFTPGVVILNWMSDKPVLRAAGHYGLGLMMVAQRSAGGNTIYWMGNVVKSAGPLYFPIVYFLKESLAWWLLASLALASLIVRSRRKKHQHTHKPRRGEWLADRFDEFAILTWLVIYWGTSITSTLNIGVRHLLPVYPFMILLVAGRLGAVLGWLRRYNPRRMRIAAGVMSVLLGWYVFEGVSTFPHFLTYFNQIAGGPSGGYRYVVDSNLDWGQDARRLADYLDEQGIDTITLDYFGWADPSYYLPGRIVWTTSGRFTSSADFIKRNESDGWIGVSATFLQNANGFKTFDPADKKNYLWLTLYKPETVIGNSIFVWHIK